MPNIKKSKYSDVSDDVRESVIGAGGVVTEDFIKLFKAEPSVTKAITAGVIAVVGLILIPGALAITGAVRVARGALCYRGTKPSPVPVTEPQTAQAPKKARKSPAPKTNKAQTAQAPKKARKSPAPKTNKSRKNDGAAEPAV